ncbi:hypothetical protein [Amycolatopsis thermophila]|uniref:Uncharacterized protein n=1 Tax=Amycolatopsis thermophila TaxID=206084 RepID=A0ABU0EUX2_9PSEU|nr:hypothetical protein [Amycolatopsis thermophila]MDQ0378592.1 hypothetical protein [Amycolatopsis thermophila]
MSKTKIALPKSSKLRKLCWLALAVVILAWVVKNPYQVRDGLDQLVHALSVVFSGWGGR